MHETDLILMLTAGLAAAFALGFFTHRLGLSPILGYLLAGIAIGPHTPGFVGNAAVAAQFAEVGVILLMFGVGLHFRLRDLIAVRGIAVPGALGQIAAATGLGAALALGAGWSVAGSVTFGIALSVASTVVLLRVLTDHARLDTVDGHVAIGWLVVEDLFTVFALVLLPALAPADEGAAAGGTNLAAAVGLTILKLAGLIAITAVAGARLLPRLLVRVARSRSPELFTLCVLATALTVATGSAMIFGVSMALGAFLAGMIVGQSPVSHQAAANALPMRDAFAVLFFVSVGMLFDPAVVTTHPGLVAGALAVVLLGKPLAAVAIVLGLGWTVPTALTVAIALAQIGEFSFILADLGGKLNLFPPEARSVLVAAALVSIAVNPLLMRSAGPLEARLRRRKRLWALLNRRAERRGREASGRTETRIREAPGGVSAVVVGYGPAGRTVARILKEFGVPPTIVDLNVDTVAELVRNGESAVYGDGARGEILQAAGIRQARYLVVTLPDLGHRMPVIAAAREANPSLRIFVRARYLAERAMLEEMGATAVCYEEVESAVALAQMLLQEAGAPAGRVDAEADRIRREFEIRPWRSLHGGTEGGP